MSSRKRGRSHVTEEDENESEMEEDEIDSKNFLFISGVKIDIRLFHFLASGTYGITFRGISRTMKPEKSERMIIKFIFIKPKPKPKYLKIIENLFSMFTAERSIIIKNKKLLLSETSSYFDKEVDSHNLVNQLSYKERPLILSNDGKTIYESKKKIKFSGNLISSGIIHFNKQMYQFIHLFGLNTEDEKNNFNEIRIGAILMEDETDEFQFNLASIKHDSNYFNIYLNAAFKTWFELCLNGIIHLDPNYENFIFKRKTHNHIIEARMIDFSDVKTDFTLPDNMNPVLLFNFFYELLLNEFEREYPWLLEASKRVFNIEPKAGGKSRNHKKQKSKTYKKKPK
jgi:hypothetical protein